MTEAPTCDDCGRELAPALGGDVCHACQIFYAPYGFEDNWEIR